ncbi:hypothetical protein TWF694_005047 [Orbilia ellipsospora]|uniref:Uncharacterized protein n=1 Tax=Orbilia ellipsospora TaxID=2528407 RepID=A0AAV9WUF6_9PEZI
MLEGTITITVELFEHWSNIHERVVALGLITYNPCESTDPEIHTKFTSPENEMIFRPIVTGKRYVFRSSIHSAMDPV